ncbi:uncharacterized protein LOC116145825 [Pistacia vera]|uniref:uncharacterized protein LOC116145825 n=1 Tax=Pistacia vera TaxID=55513 RepID=UPI001262EAED|nr:uncharacterized protein LOC116145825 [Pistacia vera]
MLHLPFSSGYYVEDISYLDRSITIMDMNDTTCPIQSLLSLNLTDSKFSLLYSYYNQMYALWNCSTKIIWNSALGPFDCMTDERGFVYGMTYDWSVDSRPPVCSMYKTVNISIEFWYQNNQTKKIVIEWEALDGWYDCEKSGNYCGFNTTSNSTICVINQLQWNPAERPSMSMVLQMLEGEFKSLEIPPKPFVSSDEEMDGN